MVPTSYLRVYQTADAFGSDERRVWLNEPEPRDAVLSGAARRWLIASALPVAEARGGGEGAFVRQVDDSLFICPRRTRLRMLAGLLAFRDSIPEEVADAFVPEAEARRAAHELAALDRARPDIRSHILQANWHVPLRWFPAFEGSERILVEDKDGLRIRYEAGLAEAKARLVRALGVLETSGLDEGVTGAIEELLTWLNEFEGRGLLELDYGSVGSMFPPEELLEDDSAAQVWLCIDSLAAGDASTAGTIFEDLAGRWTSVRAREVVN